MRVIGKILSILSIAELTTYRNLVLYPLFATKRPIMRHKTIFTSNKAFYMSHKCF